MIPIVSNSSTADNQVCLPNPMLVLHGFSCAETAGSAGTAELVIRHGTKATDPMIVAPINFAADGFGYPTFFPVPMQCPNGIYVDRVSGETTVVVYVDYE